jgi:RAB protein geranylgeranyltransferase component A
VVVLGTGLVESIVAAAAARGKLSPSVYDRKKTQTFLFAHVGLHNIDWIIETLERQTNSVLNTFVGIFSV